VSLKESLRYHLQEHPEWEGPVKLSKSSRLFLWHELRNTSVF